MIKDLVVKLMEEANQESSHKGWCDTELGTNKQTRDNKAEQVASLSAEVDTLTSTIAQTSEEVTTLTAQIAELDKSMAEKTEFRNGEKAENAATVTDSEAAQTALAQALIVLKEFYAKASDATSLIESTDTAAAPYKGMQGQSSGVVAMLEVIAQDFAHLQTETQSAEDIAVKTFEEFMETSKVSKSQKNASLKFKTEKVAEDQGNLKQRKNDLSDTQTQLDAALAYFDKLKPSCIDSGISYEDRVARRNEEIASLKEALTIMAESVDRR